MIARWLKFILCMQIMLGMILGSICALHFGSIWAGLTGAVAGWVLAFAGHPVVIATDYAITRRYRSPIPKELQISAWQGFLTYCVEVGSSLRSFSWAHPFLSARPAPVPEARNGERLPILFVHGYFCNRALWGPFMRAADARGHACDAVTLEPPFAPIDDYAASIEKALQLLLAQTRSAQAVIVAHSMGGLAARAWARRYGAGCAARIITLGAPHAGTVMAALGHGGNVAQMRRDSAWLSTLADGESQALRAKFICLFSYHDNIVAPHLSATLEGAENIALAGIGHVRLVYEPRIWDKVFTRLERL